MEVYFNIVLHNAIKKYFIKIYLHKLCSSLSVFIISLLKGLKEVASFLNDLQFFLRDYSPEDD